MCTAVELSLFRRTALRKRSGVNLAVQIVAKVVLLNDLPRREKLAGKLGNQSVLFVQKSAVPEMM
jgi:hypothetical protein